jgi:hypothetical protein
MGTEEMSYKDPARRHHLQAKEKASGESDPADTLILGLLSTEQHII